MQEVVRDLAPHRLGSDRHLPVPPGGDPFWAEEGGDPPEEGRRIAGAEGDPRRAEEGPEALWEEGSPLDPGSAAPRGTSAEEFQPRSARRDAGRTRSKLEYANSRGA